MELFISPVEIVVKFEQHHRRCRLEDRVFCLGICSSIRDESREKLFVLRSDSKIHHEIEVDKLISVKLTHGVVHLVLLTLEQSKGLSTKVSSMITCMEILVEELVDCCKLLLVRCETIQEIAGTGSLRRLLLF